MNLQQIENPADYLRLLEQNAQEAAALFNDLLIGVTSFFRDPEAFKVLSRVLKEMLAKTPKDSTLRIWVPGCSSGEEVYSIAIVLRECMDALKKHFSVQIFGTDIDAEAIETARAGIYPDTIANHVAPARLRRFFLDESDGYHIKKEIREMAIFSLQDLVKDPPFTKLDLLSCRNLLIYLDAELQKRLVPLFHYALRPDGILFLGPSESIDGYVDLFARAKSAMEDLQAQGLEAWGCSKLAISLCPAPQRDRRDELPGGKAPRAGTRGSPELRRSCCSTATRRLARWSTNPGRFFTATARPADIWRCPKARQA